MDTYAISYNYQNFPQLEARLKARGSDAHVHPWQGRAIGLMDLDAFFASAEVLRDPGLTGKPLVVGGSRERRGVVATASYEARRYGIHSAMSTAQALKLCPDLLVLPPDFGLYRQLSDEIMAILLDETPFVEQMSIDEAFFDITPGRFSKESPLAIAARIQRRIAELGISASCGIATNRTTAKIASEVHKPQGITCVIPGCEREFLAPLPLSRMPGIGRSAQAKFKLLGKRTLGDVAHMDQQVLMQMFGEVGRGYHLKSQGKDLGQVLAHDLQPEAKSISKERSYTPDLDSLEKVERELRKLTEEVAQSLQEQGLYANTVFIKLKYGYESSHGAQTQLDSATNLTEELWHKALRLMRQHYNGWQKVRLIGVGVSHFSHTRQLSLDLGDAADSSDSTRLFETSDKIRQRFGTDAIRFGRDFDYRKQDGEQS